MLQGLRRRATRRRRNVDDRADARAGAAHADRRDRRDQRRARGDERPAHDPDRKPDTDPHTRHPLAARCEAGCAGAVVRGGGEEDRARQQPAAAGPGLIAGGPRYRLQQRRARRGTDNRRRPKTLRTQAARGPTMADLAPAQLASEVRRRRTFAIISHPDAGKTTLTEKLLLFSGAIQIAGSVKARKATRHATSDWMEIEKQRGISVASSVMQMAYRDHVINLLDTPGHKDFSEDTYRVLTAVDSALMVIDAANGVEAQTRRLIEVCRQRNTPIITFVNKMDREVRDPLDILDEVERELGMPCVPMTWPVGQGKTFGGIINLRTQTMTVFESGSERLPHDFDAMPLSDPAALQK